MVHLDSKIPHQLTQELALFRIQEIISELQNKHRNTINNVSQEWIGYDGRFSFTIKALSINCKIYVGVDTVRVGGRIPFVLSFYKSRIIDTIEKKGVELLRNREPVT